MDSEDIRALGASFSRRDARPVLDDPEDQWPASRRLQAEVRRLSDELDRAVGRVAALTNEAAQLSAEAARLHGERDQLQTLTAQLQTALLSRVVIEQAKGMIAAHTGDDVDAAFRVMRKYARDHNKRLHDVAASVVERRLSPHLLS